MGRAVEHAVISSRLHNLLRPEVLAAFDRTFFEREGYWVWEGILTAAGRKQWTASLRQLQEINDRIVMDTNWGAIDYTGRGLPVPLADKITPTFLAACCGGSEQMTFMAPELRVYMNDHGLFGPEATWLSGDFEWQGMMPEYFPAAYDDFILDITTDHPQMMELFTRLFGGRFISDHCIMLNRTPGSRGRRWHAHAYRRGEYEVEDEMGTGKALTTEYLSQQCIRTLCYPEGMDSNNGGGDLAVIPGAHLYRIPYLWNSSRTEDDSGMEKTWMQGKVHAYTGAPLAIERLSLPPGSMVSFVHHMPHHVGNRDQGTEIRWGLLMAYRTPDPLASPTKWTNGVATHWVERLAATDQLTAGAYQVYSADVTMNSTCSNDPK